MNACSCNFDVGKKAVAATEADTHRWLARRFGAECSEWSDESRRLASQSASAPACESAGEAGTIDTVDGLHGNYI